jgi:hypothetical protein
METKEFNLVEILKDCSQGMELYSLMHGVVKFDHIYDDRVYVKGWGVTTFVDARGRYLPGLGECILFPSKENRDWTTFNAPIKVIERFNPESLKPYDKVLGRDNLVSRWSLAFFSHIDHNIYYPYKVTPGCGFTQVIPYKGNEHLLGKCGEPDEYYRYWEDKDGQTAST